MMKKKFECYFLQEYDVTMVSWIESELVLKLGYLAVNLEREYYIV